MIWGNKGLKAERFVYWQMKIYIDLTVGWAGLGGVHLLKFDYKPLLPPLLLIPLYYYLYIQYILPHLHHFCSATCSSFYCAYEVKDIFRIIEFVFSVFHITQIYISELQVKPTLSLVWARISDSLQWA